MNETKVLLIIPAYNEEACILETYQTIQAFKKTHTKFILSLIVINDGSSDATQSICEQHKIPHINLIHNLGIGGAVQTGYKYALENNYDIAIQFDGDGQHDINYIEAIVEPIIKQECDFAIGSRFLDDNSSEFKSTLTRRIGIKVISSTIKFVTGKKIHDTTSGFRAVNQAVMRDFAKFYPVEYPEPITNAQLLKNGYTLKETPVSMNERLGGESSIKAWKSIYYMVNVVLSILILKFRRK